MPSLKKPPPHYIILCIGFLCYVLIVGVVSFNFRHLTSRSIFDLQFLYGPLVKNIVTSNLYASPDLRFTGHRMPFIPYFLSAIALLRNDVLFAYIVKNIIFCSITGFVLFLWWKNDTDVPKYLKLLAVLFLAVFPQLIFWGTSPDADEGYLIHLIAALSIGLLFFERMQLQRKRFVILVLALMNAILFLTKSSMLLMSVSICLLFWLKSANIKMMNLFLSTLVLAVLLWGVMNLRHSGMFAIGTSLDGWNLYKGNNEEALSIYPPYNLDILDEERLIRYNRPAGMDEWEFNNASRARAVSFALTHPWDELRLLGRRIFILLFEVRRNPLYRGETQFASPVYWLGTFCMVVIRLAFFGCLWAGIRAVRQHLRQSSEATRGHFRNTIIYFSMTAAYAFPYLVGFVYERHLMPLVIPTVIYFVSSGYRKIRSSLVIS